MPQEIERKFLVADASWLESSSGTRMSQGYLSLDPERTVRVRLAGARAWLTIKGMTRGISRSEFEYEIPAEEAAGLLELCLPGVIDKTRHKVDHTGYLWEVDVFHGENEGLVLAEVELCGEDEKPELPPWIGGEVSHDPRYFNASLSRHPFREWGAVADR